MAAPKITIRNKQYLQSARVINGQGTIHGHKIAEAFDDVSNSIGNLATKLSANVDGTNSIPNPPGGLEVAHIGGGVIDAAITDGNDGVTSAQTWFLEGADNPGFNNARVYHASPSRNVSPFTLPNGTYWFKTYSQWQAGGPPSTAVVSGPVQVTGSVATGSLFKSQGSGTGLPGQTNQGFGKNTNR